MNSRLQAVVGIIAAALFAGCQDKNKPEEAPSQEALLAEADRAPSPAVPDAAITPDADAGVISDIELITRKAEAHARRVADEMQKQGNVQGPAAVRTGALPAQRSAVEWLDPNAYRIGPAPEPQVEKPSVPPEPPRAAMAMAEPDQSVASTANKPVSIDEAEAPIARTTRAARPASVETAEAQAEAGSRLQTAMSQMLRDNPRDISAHLDYQLLQFIQNKQAPDLAAVATLPEEDQEIVSAVIDSLANFRHIIRSDSNPLLSQKVKPLMELGERLRARADLEVPVVQLCKRVDGYGVYEPIEARLVAGHLNQVIVYCEIENFMSQLNGQSLWETKVTEELVLYTENDGLPILREEPVVVPDVCRNRRNDFFIVRKLSLPANIPVGRYLLKVTVVDQLASRVAEATIPITMVAN